MWLLRVCCSPGFVVATAGADRPHHVSLPVQTARQFVPYPDRVCLALFPWGLLEGKGVWSLRADAMQLAVALSRAAEAVVLRRRGSIPLLMPSVLRSPWCWLGPTRAVCARARCWPTGRQGCLRFSFTDLFFNLPHHKVSKCLPRWRCSRFCGLPCQEI